MAVVLYWQAISHPSQAVRKMLELKQVECKLVDVLPLNQRIHLRLAGFRGGTVPALKLDGQRVQGSRQIARALDVRWPEPALFPDNPQLRGRVEEAELWGEEKLQPLPRRLFRFGVAHNSELRRWAVRNQGLPAPGLMAAAIQPFVAYYARTTEADGRRASVPDEEEDLAALPPMLDHVDQLLADGTVATDPPNAATLQILSTIRALDAFDDLQALVRSHACAAPALQLFPRFPGQLPPFLDADWLGPVRAAAG
jgi:glutathione S-transferase